MVREDGPAGGTQQESEALTVIMEEGLQFAEDMGLPLFPGSPAAMGIDLYYRHTVILVTGVLGD
jgi:hypothetical protein